MVDPDSIFEEEEQNFHDGFVQLQNFKYLKVLQKCSILFWTDSDKKIIWHPNVMLDQTSYFKNQILDLTLSDYAAGNPEYVQTTPAGHILFDFWSLKSD